MHRVFENIFGINPVEAMEKETKYATERARKADELVENSSVEYPPSAGDAETVQEDGVLQAIARARKAAEAEGVEYVPRPELSVSLQFITPSRAKRLIENMIKNQRNLSVRHVEKLVRAMLEEHFYTIHQGIAILDTGETADGQHRLEAIVRSGRPQWMVVVSGVNKEALLAMDRGKARTQANYLSLMGKSEGIIMAASARVVMKAFAAWDRGLKLSSAQSQNTEAYQEMETINDMYEEVDVRDLALASRRLNKAPGIPNSVGAAFYYLGHTCYKGPGEDVDEFILMLQGSPPGTAAHLMGNKVSRDLKPLRASQMEYLAYMILTFGKFVEARQAGREEAYDRLRMPGGDLLPRFPKHRAAPLAKG